MGSNPIARRLLSFSHPLFFLFDFLSTLKKGQKLKKKPCFPGGIGRHGRFKLCSQVFGVWVRLRWSTSLSKSFDSFFLRPSQKTLFPFLWIMHSFSSILFLTLVCEPFDLDLLLSSTQKLSAKLYGWLKVSVSTPTTILSKALLV